MEKVPQYEDFKEMLKEHKGAKRLEDEKFEDYKLRRKKESLETKIYLKGSITANEFKKKSIF